MTELDRALALALLKRLWQRGLIDQQRYADACQARALEPDRFPPPQSGREADEDADPPVAGAAARGQVPV